MGGVAPIQHHMFLKCFHEVSRYNNLQSKKAAPFQKQLLNLRSTNNYLTKSNFNPNVNLAL